MNGAPAEAGVSSLGEPVAEYVAGGCQRKCRNSRDRALVGPDAPSSIRAGPSDAAPAKVDAKFRLGPLARDGSLRESRELAGVVDAHRDLAPADASVNALRS